MAKLEYYEVPAKDPDKIKKFYSKVLGWKFKAWSKKYWAIDTGEKGVEGGLYLQEKMKGVVPSFSVPDVEQVHKKVVANGGKVFMMMDEGNHIYFKDPEGTIFGIWEE
jgi:predicted enzyme related to lactoylglutathione lyase